MLFLLLLVLLFAPADEQDLVPNNLQEIKLVGPIFDTTEVVEQLDKARENNKVKGVLLTVNSPGGTVPPSIEVMYAVKCLKDPTRGGLASNLNEMAQRVGFILEEDKIPVRTEVLGACEMLGLDVLTVANEGKMIFAVAPDVAEKALDTLHSHPLGRHAAVIGHADERAGLVRLNTHIGGQRIIDTPYGEELPRIC